MNKEGLIVDNYVFHLTLLQAVAFRYLAESFTDWTSYIFHRCFTYTMSNLIWRATLEYHVNEKQDKKNVQQLSLFLLFTSIYSVLLATEVKIRKTIFSIHAYPDRGRKVVCSSEKNLQVDIHYQ